MSIVYYPGSSSKPFGTNSNSQGASNYPSPVSNYLTSPHPQLSHPPEQEKKSESKQSPLQKSVIGPHTRASSVSFELIARQPAQVQKSSQKANSKQAASPESDKQAKQSGASKPSQKAQQSQCHDHAHVSSPRQFEVISPSGKKVSMIFVERVSHVTAQVEYGLVPADPKLRKYDEEGKLVGNEGMELLSPKVYEDTPRGTFFFAERRPPSKPATANITNIDTGKGDDEQHTLEKEVGAKDRRVATIHSSKLKHKSKSDGIPTLLEQLVKLGVLQIIPNVRSRSREHSLACLVRVLLSDSEVGHSCSSPRHSYVLYEAPKFARFKVCVACRAVLYRRGVYYCSEACLAADWPQHRIECGKTYEQLQGIISMLPSVVQPHSAAPTQSRVQTQQPIWYRAWPWMGYAAETSYGNTMDFKRWKKNVKPRMAVGCKDLLPGF